MKRVFALAACMMVLASPARADCDTQKIEAALGASLDGMKPYERDVSDVQSTEGGYWHVYREKDGRLHSIVSSTAVNPA